MNNQEAIAQLKEINREVHIYSEAVDMAIQALTREDKTRQMLEAEKNKSYGRSEDYRDGRISAFYDALGVNYAD